MAKIDHRQGKMVALKGLPPTLTVEQAGQLLGISRRSAYRAANTGELPTIKLGRRLLVPTARVLDLLLSEERLGGVGIERSA